MSKICDGCGFEAEEGSGQLCDICSGRADARALEHALTIAKRERDAAKERAAYSETWRRLHLAWQDWAADLLKVLCLQPPGGQHGDKAAREIIGRHAIGMAPPIPRCVTCGCRATRHELGVEELRECRDCECQQYAHDKGGWIMSESKRRRPNAAIDRLADRTQNGHLLAAMGGEELLIAAADEIDRLRGVVTKYEHQIERWHMEIVELRRKLQALADAGTGYSQQTVDAIVKERDRLLATLERYRKAALASVACRVEHFQACTHCDDMGCGNNPLNKGDES